MVTQYLHYVMNVFRPQQYLCKTNESPATQYVHLIRQLDSVLAIMILEVRSAGSGLLWSFFEGEPSEWNFRGL